MDYKHKLEYNVLLRASQGENLAFQAETGMFDSCRPLFKKGVKIMNKFEKLSVALRYWLLGRKYFKAVEAMEFASKLHVGLRKDGVTVEFMHQISITHYLRTLSDLRSREETLIAGLLHDVVEDYNVPIEKIRDLFGEKIATAVLLLSKVINGVKKTNKEYYYAMQSDPIASIVKGGDRINNFQTMQGVFSVEKQIAYIRECEEHILPMLKEARRNFPDQELAYENIKHALVGQIQLLKESIKAKEALGGK